MNTKADLTAGLSARNHFIFQEKGEGLNSRNSGSTYVWIILILLYNGSFVYNEMV